MEHHLRRAVPWTNEPKPTNNHQKEIPSAAWVQFVKSRNNLTQAKTKTHSLSQRYNLSSLAHKIKYWKRRRSTTLSSLHQEDCSTVYTIEATQQAWSDHPPPSFLVHDKHVPKSSANRHTAYRYTAYNQCCFWPQSWQLMYHDYLNKVLKHRWYMFAKLSEIFSKRVTRETSMDPLLGRYGWNYDSEFYCKIIISSTFQSRRILL